MVRPIKVGWVEDRIICFIPITSPTSKARVKRRLGKTYEPIAVRQKILKEDDLIEWQISYFDKEKRLIEVGKMLELAYKYKIFTQNELKELKKYVDKIEKIFDESFNIEEVSMNDKFLDEFEIIYEKTPIIQRILSNNCFVRVILRHKQRAVGYQSMLYIYIPLTNVISKDKSIIGRSAEANEEIKWSPSKIDIEGVIKSFAIASQKHRNDIKEIIGRIISI